MKYHLNFLNNGLVTCKIKLTNPYSENEQVLCDALIDTGADHTVICQSIFEKFSIDQSKTSKHGVSTLNKDDDNVSVCFLKFNVPARHWFQFHLPVAVLDLSKRKEYTAILGVNALQHFRFFYSPYENVAWLMDK